MSEILPNENEQNENESTDGSFVSAKRTATILVWFSAFSLLLAEVPRLDLIVDQFCAELSATAIVQAPIATTSNAVDEFPSQRNDFDETKSKLPLEVSANVTPSHDSQQVLNSKREVIAEFQLRRTRSLLGVAKAAITAPELESENKSPTTAEVGTSSSTNAQLAAVESKKNEPTAEEAPIPLVDPVIGKVSFQQPIAAQADEGEKTDSENVDGASHRTAPQEQFVVEPAEIKLANFAKANDRDDNEKAPLPPGVMPFEVIDQVGEIRVTLRRSKILQLKKPIFRNAIVDPSICDIIQFTPQELSLIGKTVGSTHVTFWFEGEQRPQTFLVTVEPDATAKLQVEREYAKLEDILTSLFPDSKVHLSVMANKLVVRGQAKDAEEAAQILVIIRSQAGGGGGAGGAGGGIGGGLGSGVAAQVLSDWEAGQNGGNRPQLQVVNMLRVPGIHQVALRVKIAEINRTAARGFGVDLGGHVNFTNNPKGSQLFLSSLLGMANGTGTGGNSLLFQVDGDDITIGIRYLQQHGVVRLLSEPTLVTMSGLPATFLAGGEFAVPTIVGSAGLNAVTTDFRSFGAIVSFLPTVLDKDRIRLQVSPEFSQVDSSLTVGSTPGLKTRAVNTTVEMREGQTLAIAGLLEDNMKTSNKGIYPFLYPWIGQRDSSRNETELLILVTPELVHPMDPEEVPPLPGFDITEPDNWQFYVGAKIEGNPTRNYRSTVWPRLLRRYNAGGPAMISGPFGHGQ